jgi:hypothetical protein
LIIPFLDTWKQGLDGVFDVTNDTRREFRDIALTRDQLRRRHCHSLEASMATITYQNQLAGLLVVDPYNDFISEGGKIWPHIKGVAEANDCVPHMLQILHVARKAGLRVFYAPHHRYRPGDYETWKYIAPIQKAAWSRKTFEYGTWGGEFRGEFEPRPGEIVAQEHWCSSGFANTDLDLQAQEAWHPSAHRHRPDRAYLHRSDRALRRRTRLRGHGG